MVWMWWWLCPTYEDDALDPPQANPVFTRAAAKLLPHGGAFTPQLDHKKTFLKSREPAKRGGLLLPLL